MVSHLLQKLITFRTVSGNTEAVRACFDWIREELRPAPLHLREYDVGGYPALVITPSRKKHVKLWLAAHVDVVPGPERLFVPEVRGRRLYGRGAFDMKFAIACYLALMRELGARVRSHDIGIMLTSDEELGGKSSVRHLLEKEGFTGDVAFLPDGTGSWVFEESAKGMLRVRATARGVRAHGSRPWHGRSAIHHLAAFICDAVRAFEPYQEGCDGAHHHPTMHVGMIEGGEAFNVVAPEAHATLDIRYPHIGERTEIKRLLARMRAAHPHVSLRYEGDERPYGILRSNGYATDFAQSAREVADVECGWARAHGTSDARFFNKAGTPTLLIAPKGGDAHGEHEWVDIRDLELYYRVLRHFVENGDSFLARHR